MKSPSDRIHIDCDNLTKVDLANWFNTSIVALRRKADRQIGGIRLDMRRSLAKRLNIHPYVIYREGNLYTRDLKPIIDGQKITGYFQQPVTSDDFTLPSDVAARSEPHSSDVPMPLRHD